MSGSARQATARCCSFAGVARPHGRSASSCLVHGHGDHSGIYADAMTLLSKSGYAVCALDLRGHGRSGKPRGDAPTYQQLLDDVGLLLDESVRCFGAELPRFLFGHSHGGGLVLNYALRRRPALNAVIATSPWLRLAFRPPRWTAALARVLHAVAPDYWVAPRDERKALPDLVGRGRPKPRDEMVHRVITARLFFESRAAGDGALRHVREFPLPLLVMHGVDDRATSPEASRQFVESIPGDATFVPLSGLRHLIHVDEIEEELFARVLEWTDARR